MKRGGKVCLRRSSVLSLWAFLSVCGSSWALNLGQLQLRVRQLIADQPYYTPAPKLTDRQITDWLNEGQRFAIAYPFFLVNRTTFSLSAGTTEYAVPKDFQAAKRVTLDGVSLPETTLDALDSTGGNWAVLAGRPVQYYTRFTTFTVIGFEPWPDSSGSSTGTILMDYYGQASDLVNPTDIPFGGVEALVPLHESLAHYCVYRFYLLSGNQLYTIYAQEFLRDIDRLRSVLEAHPNYRPGFQIQPLIQRQ